MRAVGGALLAIAAFLLLELAVIDSPAWVVAVVGGIMLAALVAGAAWLDHCAHVEARRKLR